MSGFWYLASPYTLYFRGPAQAAHDAVAHAALLVELGINVFTPVGHSHQMEQATPVSLGWRRWMDLDLTILHHACGLIRLQLPGWKASRGMNEEEDFASARGKPVIVMEPWPARGSVQLQALLDELVRGQEGLSPVALETVQLDLLDLPPQP